MDLKLLQKDVAQRIGCDQMSVVNWEKNHTQPRINQMPAVIAFLGYNPLPTIGTIGDRLISFRRARGMTQIQLAEQLGFDPSTLARWERGAKFPTPQQLASIERLLWARPNVL